jgi:serine phosphatase RsbU (regulator of sigma subunit)
MVAIRGESHSLWGSARARVRRAVTEISRAVARDEPAPSISETTLISEFVTATRGAESPAEALRIAVATLGAVFGAESALLLEKGSTGEYRGASATLPADGFLLGRLRAHASPLPLSTGDYETLLRWAAEHRPAQLAEIETLKTIAARIAVPVRTKDEILGVLLLGPRAAGVEYGIVEKQVLRACANQLALMIENARLTARVVEQEKLRRDLALATEVQRRLLPDRPPDGHMAALAAVSLPARSVGGDYYDFIDVGDNRIGIALADVAGKGVAAALIMSVVQASLRILASEGDISMPQLAAKMNSFLHRSTASNSYATFFYAQIDERSRQLRYVNAGHLPPYLLRSSDLQELSAGGAVIGLFPHMSYEEATIDLQSGDVLVAFTDGVTEALNANDEEFGDERLKALLRRLVHLPVQEIASKISEELRTWITDTSQYDDLTFVVMKVN